MNSGVTDDDDDADGVTLYVAKCSPPNLEMTMVVRFPMGTGIPWEWDKNSVLRI